MQVLPDILGAWGELTTIPVPTYLVPFNDSVAVYCVNGMPLIVWPTHDNGFNGRFVMLHINSAGESTLIEDFIPFGYQNTRPGFYVFDNTIINTWQDRVKRSQFAIDPATGLIASVHTAIEQGGFTTWCGAGTNRSLQCFPAYFSDRIHVYGLASAGGDFGGTEGPFKSLVYAERGDPTSDTWNATQIAFPELGNYYGVTTNGSLNGHQSGANAIALNEGLVGFSYKPSLNTDPNYRIIIKRIKLDQQFNVTDCSKKYMKFGSEDLIDINMYTVYGAHTFGDSLYGVFPTNYYSCNMKSNNPNTSEDWVIYVKYKGPVIQRMVLNSSFGQSGPNPDTWPSFVFDDGTTLKIGYRLTEGATVYVYKANVIFDTSKPQFDLPAFPIQPAPVRSSDLRTLYRSK